MEEPDFEKMEITVVGLGLIGGSYAMALRKLNPQKIWGIDVDPGVLTQAEEMGVIDGGFLKPETPLRVSDVVVLCVYPGLAAKFMRDNMACFKENAVITDTAGNKSNLMNEIRNILRDDLDFIGGHPLAGKESYGFAFASRDIFENANYLLTPASWNKGTSITLIQNMIRGLGCRQPIYLDPLKHDEIIAFTSQLPHVIAAALMNSSAIEDTGLFIGGSFRDATRVAKINVELWSELLWENKANVLRQMAVFSDKMSGIQRALEQDNPRLLEEILRRAAKERERF